MNRKKKWNSNRQNPRVEDCVEDRVGEEGGGGVGDGALGDGDHDDGEDHGDHRPLAIWVVFSVVV